MYPLLVVQKVECLGLCRFEFELDGDGVGHRVVVEHKLVELVAEVDFVPSNLQCKEGSVIGMVGSRFVDKPVGTGSGKQPGKEIGREPGKWPGKWIGKEAGKEVVGKCSLENTLGQEVAADTCMGGKFEDKSD